MIPWHDTTCTSYSAYSKSTLPTTLPISKKQCRYIRRALNRRGPKDRDACPQGSSAGHHLVPTLSMGLVQSWANLHQTKQNTVYPAASWASIDKCSPLQLIARPNIIDRIGREEMPLWDFSRADLKATVACALPGAWNTEMALVNLYSETKTSPIRD